MSSNHHSFVFNDDTLSRCDEIAAECFGEANRKKLIPELKSALYVNKADGDCLLVCTDESILFVPAEIGRSLLIAGFKNGLRSNIEAVKRSKASKLVETSF
jgi:hypothetical protein